MRKEVIMTNKEFKWPPFFDNYSLRELYWETPVQVVGVDENNRLISYRFDNLDEAETKLPNLHTEFTSPMKDVDPNDPERKKVCIRFESWKACDMLSR
jgi:hypothetical protein